MLDIKKIINEKEYVITNLNKRGKDYTLEIEEIIKNYEIYLLNLKKEEEAQSLINKLSKEIGDLKREKKDTTKIFDQIETNKKIISSLNSKEYKEKYIEQLMLIPNLISEDTPIGKDETQNKEIKVWGDKQKFSFKPKDHYEISEIKEKFNFEKAANIAKSRFVITTGIIAKLERAITNLMLDTHTAVGYEETTIPFMVGEETLRKSGQLPKFKDDLFKLENNTKSEVKENNRNFYLIPTGEVVLANLYQNEIINEEFLPLKHMTYSPCFRKEAGSAGRDTRGIIRMHQFGKVELFKFVKEEDTFKELEKMVENATKILELLKLPYRVVDLCTGDIGFGAHKTYDIEVWMPGQEKYRECSSCSTTGDFQGRRTNTKYKTKNNEKKYMHLLNGSGMATGRILAAVLENYQKEDGTIEIPEVLKAYIK